MTQENNFNLWQWALILGTAAFATVIAEYLQLGPKWENAVVYTVVVFVVVILALRQLWSYNSFWRNAAMLLALHILAISVFEESLPSRSEGPHGVPLTLAGMAEGLLIARVLWKRGATERTHPDS